MQLTIIKENAKCFKTYSLYSGSNFKKHSSFFLTSSHPLCISSISLALITWMFDKQPNLFPQLSTFLISSIFPSVSPLLLFLSLQTNYFWGSYPPPSTPSIPVCFTINLQLRNVYTCSSCHPFIPQASRTQILPQLSNVMISSSCQAAQIANLIFHSLPFLFKVHHNCLWNTTIYNPFLYVRESKLYCLLKAHINTYIHDLKV